MRCMMCESFSFSHICKECRENFLTPSIYKRKISNTIEAISFYKYSEIEPLLHTKHSELGFYIYSILANIAMKKFSSEFSFIQSVASVAIDDHVRHGYSHTAILSNALKSDTITPRNGILRAKNRDRYSAQTYQYRLEHPREFIYRDFKESSVIIVDDIITTSLTLKEAIDALEKNSKEVLLCLCLADASQKD